MMQMTMNKKKLFKLTAPQVHWEEIFLIGQTFAWNEKSKVG